MRIETGKGLARRLKMAYRSIAGAGFPRLGQKERSAARDVLPAMAEAFGVNVVELLAGNGERLSVQKKGRAPGRVRQVFDDVSRLPRRQQEHIARWVSAFVRQYEEERR